MPRHALILTLLIAAGLAPAQAQPPATMAAVTQASVASTAHVEGATTLLVQDVRPWRLRSNERVLKRLGVAFDVVGSRQLGSVDLSLYSTIIVASYQEQSFYDALALRFNGVERWLSKGARTLEFHGAFQGSNTRGFDLPGHVHATWSPSDTNVLTWADDPLTQGLPDRMTGDYASHVIFERPHIVKAHVLIGETRNPRQAVMIDYCVGAGRVIATGQTVEYAFYNGWDFAPVLSNMIAASTQTPGCPM